MANTEITTIDEVLTELDQIVDLMIEENSPLGIFAYVYRRTTAKIAEGIEQGRFENPERMERFDVDFACLYIEAFWHHRDDQPISFSWEVAFDAADNGDAIIIQHLLLGMNAHINLDLGIAAARTAPGDQIYDLEHDFMLVNKLLAELVDEVQLRISRVSPLMFLLDLIGKNNDEAIVNFSITKARDYAWKFARNLAQVDGDQEAQERMIRRVDEQISGLGSLVAYPPGFLLPRVLSVIRYFEKKDVRVILERLRA
ncbi:DUF5995 family protein [Aliifodinibius sp. S!AR15-10]|uniref:DUF5995 family protein n=1 Tax=Aliifodinibius sp. S!AR15-10 TaxID=2950437 RepID=UPI00285B6781|nr:DUF5995 family protein [Aliifodinibius sp. S!AR15-10]MDR8391414.1 DUF5995 family protein [Aliifodinibius sp. S!AR15-10]